MKKLFTFLLFLLLGVSLFPKPMIQYPAVYSDGESLAFTYNGDIYRYNINSKELIKITNNVDYDYRPIWSPSGDKIGFTSNRSGNFDVYIIDSKGGHPERLTFNSNFDGLYCWPEAEKLYIGTYRSFKGKRTYEINKDGKILKKVVDYGMFKAKKNSKGEYLFISEGVDTSRRKYTGSASRDILVYDEKNKKIDYKVKNSYMNIFPVWGESDNIIYYISNKDGTANIWKKNLSSNSESKITNFNSKEVQWLYSSPDGRYLSFVADYEPFIYDTGLKKIKKIDIEIETDYPFTSKKLKKIGFSGFKEAEISRDGKNILFACEGDILKNDTNKKNDDEVYPKNLTDTPEWERDIVWSPNNQIFAYVSTKGGTFDIHISDVSGKHTKRLTSNSEIETLLDFSKNGRYLAYCRFPQTVIIHDMKDHKEKKILEMPYLYDLSWGPNNEYLVISRSDINYNQDIYIISKDGKFKRNISLSSGGCFNPKWNKKGDEVYWIENKFGKYSIKKLNINPKNKDGVSIKSDDDFILNEKQKEVYSLKGKEIKDFRLIDEDKSISIAVNSDSLKGIIKYNMEEEKAEILVKNQKIESMRVNDKNERIYYLSGGSLYSIRYSGRDTDSYSAESFKHINKKDIVKELYNQSWLLLEEWFYDSKLHNKNLTKLRNYYDKYIEDIILKRDLYNIVDEIFGKLNASHLGIWGEREKPHNTKYETGYFGAELDNNLVVKELLNLSSIVKKVSKNDRLLAVEGEKIDGLKELDKKLIGKADKKISLLFQNAGKIELKLKTRKHFHDIYIKEKDIEKKRFVKRKSNDKLVYIHLHKMNDKNLKKFKDEIASFGSDKKGLILDIRNNSGGNIAKDILGILEKNVYAYSKRRYFTELTEEPTGYSWSRPVVVLINEKSYSNAEIFPLGIKNLKRGKVIGVPTAGGVIGTYHTTLMDGTNFRLPHVKWLTLDKINMENMGVEPDIFIENHPEDILDDKDPQLEKAIEEIMKQIK